MPLFGRDKPSPPWNPLPSVSLALAFAMLLTGWWLGAWCGGRLRAHACRHADILGLSLLAVFGVGTGLALKREWDERRGRAKPFNDPRVELSQVIDLNQDLLCISSEDQLIRLNQAWENTLGIQPSQLLSIPLLEFVHPDDREATLLFSKDLKSRMGSGELINRLRARDGSYRFIEWRCTAKDGLVYASGRDITERKQGEDAIVKLSADLKRSNLYLDQFASVASHDLQEPLRMISSFTELLARRYHGKLDPEADQYIDFAVDGAKRMQRLIEELLEYSRITSRGKSQERASSDFALGRAILVLQQVIQESGAIIQQDPLPDVQGDETQLTMLFQNLLSNAIKYHGPSPPQIRIAAVRDKDTWVFSMADNGIGIDPKYFNKIFEIFQRLHTQDEYPGTGMGLAICKRIVERHGGEIWVESEPGAGTTVHFTVPYHDFA